MALNSPPKKDTTNSRFAAQLPLNLAANIAYFLVNVVIGVLLVPYFISTLGVAAYGLIPLATSITGYVAIVVQSLNSAVTRFLTVDLQRDDFAAANRTFNTALFGLSAIILLMVPVVLVVAWFVPTIFSIPAGQENDAVLLFLGVSAAFIIRSWSGNFTVQLFAYNRLDLQNLVNLTNVLVQTGFIVLFFVLLGPNLAFIGGAYLAGAIIASGVSIVLARRVSPNLYVSIRSFDRRRVRDLCGMGWWSVVDQIGSLLFLQIDLIVVNLFFGATSAGEYAIALQWVVLLRAISGVLAGVLTPMFLTYYAKGEIETLIRVSKSAVKLMGLAMALPIGLVCGFAPQLLTVWVGPDLVFLAPLMILLTMHLAVNLAVLPLFSIEVAYNRVRVPGIVTLFGGIGNFTLAISLALFTGWGYYGVAVAGAIVLTLKNTLFTPLYSTRILGVGVHTFTRSMLPGIGAAILLGVLATVLGTLFSLTALIPLTIAGGSLALGYLLLVWRFGLSSFERGLFGSYLPENLRRFLQ
ncbi:oligosaccharide flippase family protein [Methanosphaerula palustris]|uniref:Polysaccharide biosynthesis protein n=1 Tax=Methanosphaerula palustris (strain ATCC BAA-1556 / DSM 19958 / E1-9c) TaxID=521011 RepID=B8GGD4_METPE|nr:oligosaccharide flippase family protein [Methanosphaerula palustris]ACL16189.1 polysaccharide biosynthesis protein [Methanosphaerula palustris E1-9c]